MQETQETEIWYLDQEDPLEKEMATHSSILPWKIPWTEWPGGLQSVGVTWIHITFCGLGVSTWVQGRERRPKAGLQRGSSMNMLCINLNASRCSQIWMSERIQCETHVYSNPASQFLDSELLCTMQLSPQWILCICLLWYSLLGMLWLCFWHSVRNKQ